MMRAQSRLAYACLAMLLVVATLPLRAQADSDAAVERILSPVVGIRTVIPETARTAGALGTEREGSGVVIDGDGLIVTIGYLILEADTIEIDADGETIPATLLAYDHESGFGLVRAARAPTVQAMPLGSGDAASAGAPLLVVSWGDGHEVTPARVVSRREFAGYWEYLLADAIFTAPPHPGHSGAALVSANGDLVGIGSLFVNDASGGNTLSPGNMFVPVDALKPVLGDLVAEGRRTGSAPPWLGVFTREAHGRVFVTRVATDGPAEAAGLRPGDVIIGVGGARVGGLNDFYRKIRALGDAGTNVPLDVVRRAADGLTVERVPVRSADRNSWLQTR